MLARHQWSHGRCEPLPLNHRICFILFSSSLLCFLNYLNPLFYFCLLFFYCLHHPIERTEWVSGCVVLSWQLDQPLMSVISCAWSFWGIVKITLLSNFKALYYTTLPTPKMKDTYCKCHSDNGNSSLSWKNASKVFELLDCRMKLL